MTDLSKYIHAYKSDACGQRFKFCMEFNSNSDDTFRQLKELVFLQNLLG